MKSKYLFSNQFKKVGWLLLIPGLLGGLIFIVYQTKLEIFDFMVLSIARHGIFDDFYFFTFTKNNILDELSSILIVSGSLLIAFSKEKVEDEFISKIRLDSLVWATYVNYAILILAIIFVHDITFFWVLVFNMFTLLVFFLFRFKWSLFKFKNQIRDEE